MAAVKGFDDIVNILLKTKETSVMKGDWVSLSIERLS